MRSVAGDPKATGGSGHGVRASAEFAPENPSSQVRELARRRREAYEQARVYRRNGQLVPASLREEITENGLELQRALERCADLGHEVATVDSRQPL